MLNKVLDSKTFKQTSITSVATVINGALGLLFYTVAARWLGPDAFGSLVISITTLTLIADVADLGMNSAILKFVPPLIISDKNKAWKFLKVAIETKLLTYLLVLFIGVWMAPFIAENIFMKPDLTTPLRLAMVGVGGAMFYSYVTASLQAMQKFFVWGVFNISSNLFRLILLVIVFGLMLLNTESVLIIYIICPFVGFIIGIWYLKIFQILRSGDVSRERIEVWNFSKHVALFSLIAAFSSRLDIFLGARLMSVSEVGIYGAATSLSAFYPQLISGLGVVASPKFSSFDSKDKMIAYMKKFQFLTLGVAGVSLICLPLAVWLIPLLLGSSYISAIPVFIVLMLSMIVFLVSIPVHSSLIYYYGKSDAFVWVSLGHLAIIGVGGYLLISAFGAIGAAVSVLLGSIFNLIVPLVWWSILYKSR